MEAKMSETIKITAFEDIQVKGQWRVEWFGEDGAGFVTIFSGPFAEERAKDYAMYAQERIDENEIY